MKVRRWWGGVEWIGLCDCSIYGVCLLVFERGNKYISINEALIRRLILQFIWRQLCILNMACCWINCNKHLPHSSFSNCFCFFFFFNVRGMYSYSYDKYCSKLKYL